MMKESDYEYTVSGGEKDGSDAVLRGKAHSGMQLSGKYLVDRHLTLLLTSLKLSKKRKIDITLIGHSLSAGAASIAAMEWNSKPFENARNDIQVSAHVIGFGCPALLSTSLSLATKEYVTTVIADADFIPGMSGATLFNLLLDMKSFDYRMQAEQDVEQALRETASRLQRSRLQKMTFKAQWGMFVEVRKRLVSHTTRPLLWKPLRIMKARMMQTKMRQKISRERSLYFSRQEIAFIFIEMVVALAARMFRVISSMR
jgi:hypothetical protein